MTESIIIYTCHAVGDRDIHEGNTILKYPGFDDRHVNRNGDAHETSAKRKRMWPDDFDTTGNNYTLKVTAIRKGRCSNAGHSVGDIDTDKVSAT